MTGFLIKQNVGRMIADRYCIIGNIGEGGMGSVFEAISHDDPSHKVAIKVISSGKNLNAEDLLRFQKEAALMAQIHHPNVITFYELGLLGKDQSEFGESYYIVMEIIHGINLKEVISNHALLGLDLFFKVGKHVGEALEYIHGKGIIHRDIKPQNLVVENYSNVKDMNIKVLDFGVARLGESMHFTGEKSIGDVAGTPVYMAPENFKNSEEEVDHRVDLYSLGCVLFEMITGFPPFTATNRELLQKKHLYDPVPNICSFDELIPPIVQKIIEKLLAKNPHDRYTSAHSFLTDLLKIERMYLSNTILDQSQDFQLGLSDSFQSLSSNLKLVGREHEFQQLLDFYEKTAVKEPRSRISVISGLRGQGKTRLISEVQTHFKQQKVRFISAQFSRHETSLPYNALANAFNEYLIRVFKSQPADRDYLIHKFISTLGQDAFRVSKVIPGLEPYLFGLQKQDDSLISIEEDHDKFVKAFSDFTRCLVSDEQPVVFIFDNLHWADEKSLELIDLFFSHNNTQRLYMILSYNKEELEFSPFKNFLEKFGKLKRRFQEILLNNLDEKKIGVVAAEILKSYETITPELTDFLFKCTNGNVLHLTEYLKQIVKLDLLWPDISGSGVWNYSIIELKNNKVNLVNIDLILSKYNKYEENEKKVLEIASIVGMNFYFEQVLIPEHTESLIATKVLKKALDDGILAINFESKLTFLGKGYKFIHEKSRASLYNSIVPELKSELHLLVARRLESISQGKDSHLLFSLAHHYGQSLNFVFNEEIAKKAIEYNLLAGEEAAKNGTITSAEKYFEKSLALVESNTIPLVDESTKVWILERIADFAAEQNKQAKAIKRYLGLISKPLPIFKKATIVEKISRYQLIAGILSESKKLLNKTLEEFGVKYQKFTFWLFLKSLFRITLDVLLEVLGVVNIEKNLKKVLSNKKLNISIKDESQIKINLLHALQQIAFVDNYKHALVVHEKIYEESKKLEASSDLILQTFIERGVILSFIGFYQLGYKYLLLSRKFALKVGHGEMAGYATFWLTLTYEYNKNRADKIDQNLAYIDKTLVSEKDRVWVAQIHCFKAYRALMAGKLNESQQHCMYAIHSVSTRNWLSTRAACILLLGHLLKGEKDKIALKGEAYLLRRKQVAARSETLHMSLIKLLVHYAKGHIKKARSSYLNLINEFCNDSDLEYLLPYERDFITVFSLIFPVLFQFEFTQPILRTSNEKTLFKKLEKSVKMLISIRNENIANLVFARMKELHDDPSCSNMYLNISEQSYKNSEYLLSIMCDYWHGLYIYDLGYSGKSKKLLDRSLNIASKLEFELLEYLIKDHLSAKGFLNQDKESIELLTRHASRYFKFPSDLTNIMLTDLSDNSFKNLSLQNKLSQISLHLRDHYGQGFLVAVKSELNKSKVLYSELTEYDQQTLQFIEPYFGIDMVMFFPNGDLPWMKNSVVNSDSSQAQTEFTILNSLNETVEMNTVDQTSRLEATLIDHATNIIENETTLLNSTERLEVNDPNLMSTEISKQNISAGVAKMKAQNKQLALLIPVASTSNKSAMIFLMNGGKKLLESPESAKQELEWFGAQIGMILNDQISVRYENGKSMFEHCHWLKVWQQNTLSKGQESFWNLGFQLSDTQYLLIHCNIEATTTEREYLCALLWNHFMIFKEYYRYGNKVVCANDIKNDFIYLINKFGHREKIEKVSFAFSLIDKENKCTVSGQFGAVRPLVLGGLNRVIPSNEQIFSLKAGGSLKYWEVKSSYNHLKPLVISDKLHEVLDHVNNPISEESLRKLIVAKSSSDLHIVLSENILKDVVLRRYVAALFVEQEGIGNLKKA